MTSEHGVIDNNLLSDLPPDSVIFGKSVPMLGLEAKMRRVLTANLPIVLQGESGTGKSTLAKFMHNQSGTGVGPYVAVNCAVASGTLVEGISEDVGNSSTLPTYAEFSAMGTLFLSDLGELCPQGQMLLLNCVSAGQEAVGSSPRKAGSRARIISSTSGNLRQQVNEKKFRRDLFHRLAVVTLEVPALRNRLDDLLIIANHLRQHYSEKFGFPDRPFLKRLVERMYHYDWPGNIRELENFVCRYVALGPDERVLLDLTSARGTQAGEEILVPGENLLKEVTKRALADVERQMIVKALALKDGSLKRAARVLGISYRTMMTKMDQAGLPRTRHAKKSRCD